MPNWLHFHSYTKGTLHKDKAIGFSVKTNWKVYFWFLGKQMYLVPLQAE